MKLYGCILITIILSAPAFSGDTKKMEDVINTILSEPQKTAQPAGGNRKPDGAPQTNAGANQPQPANSTPASGQDEALLQTGIQFYNSQLYDNAVSIFQKLITTYPQSPFLDSARVWTGMAHKKSFRYDEAIKHFGSVPEDSGEYPAALFHTGECHMTKGNFISAIEFYQKVAAQFPDNELADNAMLASGKLYLKNKKGQQALETVVKLIKYYPDRETIDDAYYLMGRIFEEDITYKDLELARKVFKIFLKKSSNGEPFFKNSPLIDRVKTDLDRINRDHFKLEN